jgi:type 1 glutamine amidotransferase
MRCAALLFFSFALWAQTPKRVLFITHSAGFRHDSIVTARRVLETLSPARVSVTSTEDLSLISTDGLRGYDALFFFTSGELPLSPAQKQALLDWVRSGKGFGGAHSATDTLYTWPEYGEMIGGYFDGHPWAQEVSIDIEDPTHPATQPYANAFRIVEEIYQFRAFSRDRVRVLMTLDINTVDLRKDGVNRRDNDFALAWCRRYGEGRVFYTALGHFDQTWLDPRFQRTLEGALLWLTGQVEADATPRGGDSTPAPRIAQVGEAAQGGFPGFIAAGSYVSIFGANLTGGATMAANSAARLAGTRVAIGSTAMPLLYASPTQLNVYVPPTVASSAALTITSGIRVGDAPVTLASATPGIFVVTPFPTALTLWANGLGRETPRVTLNGADAPVLFSGLAPGFVGLYQVNVARPTTLRGAVEIRLEAAGRAATRTVTLD